MCNNNKIIHWNLLKSEKKSGFGEKIALPSKMPYCFKSILVFLAHLAKGNVNFCHHLLSVVS